MPLLPTIVIAIGTVLASFLTATATSNSKLASVKESVSVVAERENNHYNEVQKSLDRIEKKLDSIVTVVKK